MVDTRDGDSGSADVKRGEDKAGGNVVGAEAVVEVEGATSMVDTVDARNVGVAPTEYVVVADPVDILELETVSGIAGGKCTIGVSEPT